VKYFGLKNLSSTEAEETNPITWGPHPGYPDGTKQEYRDWCGHPQTNHMFYSGVEGLNPGLRLTVQNPPHLMHGWVIDYDSKFIDPDKIAQISQIAPTGLAPMWVGRTYSGGARLVYEFEKPILVDNKELTGTFLKLLAKELKIKDLLPGFDDTSFDIHLQYYEVGRDWHQIKEGAPLKDDFLGLQFFNAAMKRQIRGEGMQIPIEEVAAEVARQFPQRWPGEFRVGARGPLFWIADGIDRVGCQVGDHGIMAYSERAGKSFLTWREVLGAKFVQDYEAERIGAAAAGLWFDGKSYWQERDERWISSNKDDTSDDLRVGGLSGKVGAKETASEVAKVLTCVRSGEHKVDGAVPFVHCKDDLVVLPNGYRYLNISVARVIQPADEVDVSKFPWIYEWVTKSWDEAEPHQEGFFLAWLKHYYKSALEGNMQPGHAIIIAGDRDRGKTFFARQVIARAMGGGSESGGYLLGETSFNKACAESACWNVDDTLGAATWDKHDDFSNALKKHVANPTVLYHPKFRDAFDLPWKGRIIVTCNTDTKSLEIVPTLDGTIGDKLLLFKMGNWRPKFWGNPSFEQTIWGETPYFLAWLLQYQPPDYTHDAKSSRFGNVLEYHHPDLVRASKEASSQGRIEEMLTEWKPAYRGGDKHKKSVWMTCTQLRASLSNVPGFEASLREFGRNRLAQALRSLGPRFVLETRIRDGYREYHLNLE
jgi:hypothetical protein